MFPEMAFSMNRNASNVHIHDVHIRDVIHDVHDDVHSHDIAALDCPWQCMQTS